MAWRLAHSLVVLRGQVDQAAPRRSRASDGTLGDLAHRARASRHNPNRFNVVTGMDLTHDPAGGFDAHRYARRLVKSPHPELAYVISNGEVAKRSNGWKWEPYRGANRHDKHIHLGVGVGPDSRPEPPYDSDLLWLSINPKPAPSPKPPTIKETDMAPFILRRDSRTGKVYRVAADCQSKVWVQNGTILAVDQLNLATWGFDNAIVDVTAANGHAWLDSIKTVT